MELKPAGKSGKVKAQIRETMLLSRYVAEARRAAKDAENSAQHAETVLINKQDKLVSGVNIKTINDQDVLGSGNIVISGNGSSIAIDSELSDTSVNAVQNRVITGAVREIERALNAPPPIGLGMTGATVGDLVRVATVDTNGKPTSWEPVRFVNTHLRKWDVATCGKIVFVGNSYAKDSTAWAKWPDVAAQTLGLGAEGINWWNIGYPGSSMTTNSVEPPSFLTLLTTWVSGHADEINNIGAVVCVAGLNDSNVNSVPLLPAAITTLSNYVRTTFSHAKMYFGYTGFLNQQVNKSKPIADQSPATDGYIQRALLAYTNCIKDGALYLGGVENVIHQKSLLDTDGIHPNQEGAAQLGRAVANALLQGYAPHQSTETATVTYEREYGFAYGNMNQSSVNGIQSTVINLGFQFYDNPQSGNPDFSHCPTWTAGDVFTAGKISPPFTNGLEATDILMNVFALNVGNILCNCRVAVDKETNELKFRIGSFSTGGSSYQIAMVSSFAVSSSAPLFKDLYTTV